MCQVTQPVCRFMRIPDTSAPSEESESGSQAEADDRTAQEEPARAEPSPQGTGHRVKCGKCGHSFRGEFQDVSDLYAPDGVVAPVKNSGFTEVRASTTAHTTWRVRCRAVTPLRHESRLVEQCMKVVVAGLVGCSRDRCADHRARAMQDSFFELFGRERSFEPPPDAFK